MSQDDGDQATAPYQSDDENEDNTNENVEAEAGIIEKIRLENFMCHDHLELQFGPNVNFVCGVNGSGKSAVLVAITIALGAKASFTNRAGKMTDLIKTGKSYCAVAIRLRNRGVEAYKPDVYGKSIWVERRINREGGSSYKLKDEKEKTVSNKRSELNLILEQFNIQIDNPCNILMQDKAREFLANSSANSKYQFFLEATQLEQMRKDLQFVSEHITLMRSTLERKAKLLPEMENKVREYEQELEDINQLEQMKGHLNELKNMAAWAIVVDKEKELEAIESELEKLKKDLDKYMGRRGQATNDIDKLKKALEQKTTDATELAKKVEALNGEINNIANARTGHQREVRAKQAQLQNLEKQKKHAETRLGNVEKAIRTEEERVFSDTQKEKNERFSRIHELQTDLKERQKDESNLNTELRAVEEQQREFERELAQLERDLGEKSHKRRAIDDNIKRVNEQKANRVKVFGTQMPDIIALINKNKDKFSTAPIGPLGLRMSLKDNAWANAIESATAASLQCFIVNNYQDERMLRDLLRKANLLPPQLIVTEFTKSVYDIPAAKMPAKGFRTVLSMIEADHPMVINALIDQSKIEAKILISDRQQAQNIMFNQRPPNVNECYIPDGSRFFVRNGVEMSDTKKMLSKRLGVDFEEKLNELNTEKHALDGDIQSLKESHSLKKNEEKQIQMKMSKIKKALYTVQKEIAALKSEIQDLENVREDVLPDISELEENKKRIEEEIVKFERERLEIEEAIDNINLKSKPFVTDHDAKNKQVQELLKKSEKVEGEITNLHQAITTIQTHLGKYEQAVNKLQQEVQEKEEAKTHLEAELEDTTAKAERICDRVEVSKTHAQLDKEIGALERNLEKESRRRRTFQEVSENFVNAKKVFKTTKKTIDRMSQFCDHLEKAFKVRGKMWVQFRASIERRCKMLFNNFLSQRGYAGHVDFDHEQKKLEIKVQLERTRDEAVAQDTRSLSGGERSFSTVSLLLALWEAMESPFRAMDEFDVYMDALNRNLSVKILLQAAKEHGHRQFIFISPHDLGVVKASKRVKIIKMRPPERGFGQRTIDETIGGGRANSGDD